MRTIITSDIEFECQNMISNFLDVKFIKEKIVAAIYVFNKELSGNSF